MAASSVVALRTTRGQVYFFFLRDRISQHATNNSWGHSWEDILEAKRSVCVSLCFPSRRTVIYAFVFEVEEGGGLLFLRWSLVCIRHYNNIGLHIVSEGVNI